MAAEAAKHADLAFPTAASAMESLVAFGIVREFTGKKRNRAFAFDEYLATLNAGTEPLLAEGEREKKGQFRS